MKKQILLLTFLLNINFWINANPENVNIVTYQNEKSSISLIPLITLDVMEKTLQEIFPNNYSNLMNWNYDEESIATRLKLNEPRLKEKKLTGGFELNIDGVSVGFLAIGNNSENEKNAAEISLWMHKKYIQTKNLFNIIQVVGKLVLEILEKQPDVCWTSKESISEEIKIVFSCLRENPVGIFLHKIKDFIDSEKMIEITEGKIILNIQKITGSFKEQQNVAKMKAILTVKKGASQAEVSKFITKLEEIYKKNTSNELKLIQAQIKMLPENIYTQGNSNIINSLQNNTQNNEEAKTA